MPPLPSLPVEAKQPRSSIPRSSSCSPPPHPLSRAMCRDRARLPQPRQQRRAQPRLPRRRWPCSSERLRQ
uniref:Uncharacterized protein n=1 Tax=Arundo donax TaxID=35708 RepID=A0A0A9DVZ2_ARUDO